MLSSHEASGAQVHNKLPGGKIGMKRLSLQSDQLNFFIDLMTTLMAHSFALQWNCAKVLQIVSLQLPLVWSNITASQPSIGYQSSKWSDSAQQSRILSATTPAPTFTTSCRTSRSTKCREEIANVATGAKSAFAWNLTSYKRIDILTAEDSFFAYLIIFVFCCISR